MQKAGFRVMRLIVCFSKCARSSFEMGLMLNANKQCTLLSTHQCSLISAFNIFCLDMCSKIYLKMISVDAFASLLCLTLLKTTGDAFSHYMANVQESEPDIRKPALLRPCLHN